MRLSLQAPAERESSTDWRTKKLAISEIFQAPQGEGALIGQPMVFVRVQGCNLSCSWCDTDYAIPMLKLKDVGQELGKVVKKIQALTPARGQRWVSLTGGEPTVHKQFGLLVEILNSFGYSVLVETNATYWQDEFRELPVWWSTSPKMGSSGMSDRPTPLVDKLVELRRATWQCKFVIDVEHDYQEALSYIQEHKIPESRVWMQPCTHPDMSLEDYGRKWRWLTELVTPEGFHATVQQHVVAYGFTARGI